jgi:hypothetical protein
MTKNLQSSTDTRAIPQQRCGHPILHAKNTPIWVAKHDSKKVNGIANGLII